MIDLSFLTEAEQEAILKVLNRDAELKKTEDERVKHLHDVVDDETEYKYKSGQWFYEAKSKRHRDKIHGAELVRASIRKRKKPATIAELSELSKENSKRRWVNSVNQDIFIPPELFGVMEAPDEAEEDIKVQKQDGIQSSKKVSFTSPEQDLLRNGILFAPKPRLNPFNSGGLPDVTDKNDTSSLNSDKGQMNGPEKNKSDEEPLYASVNKAPVESSPSQEQDKKPEIGSPEVSNSKPGMDESNPILSALKRSEAKMLNSKAVQEVSPTSANHVNSSSPAEDKSVNSFPQNADKLKQLSQSVPAFLHDDVSGSVMSVYSGDFGNLDIKGGIEFSVDYVEQLKEVMIYIYQCRDLAAADVKKQRSDPYVKAYLLPEKAKMGKRKTAVKKKTLNPVYNEILKYKIPKQSLLAQTLNLSVWHNDALGRNSFLGEVNLNLGTWDWNNTQRKWYQLEPRTPPAGIGLENRGEMKLSLKYIPVSSSGTGTKAPGTGEVNIWIRECLQLPILRDNKINSFVKCTVLPDTSRKSRQKTRTVDKTPNPIFNHTMVYDGFKEEDLREACVELTVWDHNRLSNHFLGGIRIGLGTGKSYGTAVDWMDSNPEESTMWEKMIASPNTWVDGMIPLRMFKMAKLAK